MDKFVKLGEQDFVNEAKRIVSEAEGKGLVLRVLGALAIYIHSMDNPASLEIFKNLERLGEGKPFFTDLDLVAYSRQSYEIRKFFEKELNYKPNIYVNTLFAFKRNIFDHPENLFSVDVFYDKLDYSHIVNFGDLKNGRLQIDSPTIPLEDIVLEKLQIHEINRKDLVDLVVLLNGHKTSTAKEKEVIDTGYIAKVLADDWGFWYDATENLSKLKEFVNETLGQKKIDRQVQGKVTGAIEEMLKQIESEPKTRNWVKRSKTGTKAPWYKEVEEVER
jgi:hypothetical protein